MNSQRCRAAPGGTGATTLPQRLPTCPALRSVASAGQGATMSRPDCAPARVDAAVGLALRRALGDAGPVDPGRPLRAVVGLSGGCDSMLLLDAVARLAAPLPISVAAVHVHHGLSPHADDWAAFCRAEAAARGVAICVEHVEVARRGGHSLEAVAREARYAAFARCGADVLLLAHHADDQAETLLLQLLRGAGTHGLAAMAAVRPATATQPAIVRPLLAFPRVELVAAARDRGLRWIDDESNADTRLRRNYLRHVVLPAIESGFPGCPETLVRAAAHQAEAARLIDELAAADAATALSTDPVDGPTLDRSQLGTLAHTRPHRARNLLRWFLRQHALRPPSTRRLDEMMNQLTRAAVDARIAIAHDGWVLGVHRGRIHVHAPAQPWAARRWHGEGALELPHGRMVFASAEPDAFRALSGAGLALELRPRLRGERLRRAATPPSVSVASRLQQDGVPHWRRDNWPLVCCNGVPVAVPAAGSDTRISAGAGAPEIVVRWIPHPRRLGGKD